MVKYSLDTFAGSVTVYEDYSHGSCGSRLWSSPVLARYVERHREKLLKMTTTKKKNNRGSGRRPMQILELGSGLGLVSFAVAKMVEHHELSSSTVLTDGSGSDGDSNDDSCRVKIVATDLGIMLPLLRKNAAANVSHRMQSNGMFDVRELAWSSDPQEIDRQLSDLQDQRFDLVLCADCVYQVEFVPALVDTLRYVARGTSTTILVCHEIRSEEAHKMFLETAAKHFTISKVFSLKNSCLKTYDSDLFTRVPPDLH